MNIDVNFKDIKLFSLYEIKSLINSVEDELSDGDFPDDIRGFAFNKLIEKLELK